MYPNEPYQPPQQNNYDFIMNPQKPKRPGLFSPGGSSSGKQLLLLGGGVIVFIIILFTIGSMLTHKDGGAVERLTKIAQEETAMAHVAGLAGQNSSSAQTIKNFAQNTQLSMTTNQQEMVDFLAKNGVGVKADTLTKLQDPQIDAKLTSASAASNFDSTFKEIIKNMLNNYENSLRQAYAQTTSSTEKQMFADSFNDANLLQKQLSQHEY